MDHPNFITRRRAAITLLLAAAGLASGGGCQRDETVRGAGSIDIAPEDLKLKVTPRGKAGKAKS